MAIRYFRQYFPAFLFIILAVLAFLIIKPFFLAIFFGGLLAYILFPLYRRIARKIRSRTLSALCICIITVIAILVPGFFLLQSLLEQSFLIFTAMKNRFAVGIFEGCTNTVCKVLEDVSADPSIQPHIQRTLQLISSSIVENGSSLLLRIPGILLNLFVMLFTLFYALKDGPRVLRNLISFLRVQDQRYTRFFKRFNEIIRGVIFGYLVIALLQGTLGGLGFFLFGVQSPIFWGSVMAFLALIPFLGTGVIWVPASLFLILEGIFTNSNSLIIRGVGLGVYSLIMVSGFDNILRPKLISGKAKIHPLVIMLGIFGGIFLFGPLGVIVGPLLLSVTAVFITMYIQNNHGT